MSEGQGGVELRRCEIAFNVNDSRTSVARFLKKVDAYLHSNVAWMLDLRQCRYLGPDAAALLLAIVLDSREDGKAVNVLLPESPDSLRAFCEFSGLQHWLYGAAPPDRTHPRNVTVPLSVIHRANFRDADPIIDLIMRQTGIADESAEYLRLAVNELTQNIEDHSASRIGGVCCARYIAAQLQVRVAVVDRGAGVATTLRRRYPDIENSPKALSRVIAGGYSTRSRPNNAGLGLNQLWNAVRFLGGTILILSEDGSAELLPSGADSIRALDPPFQGTAAFFTLPVQPDEA